MADNKRKRRSLRIFYPRSNTPDVVPVPSPTPSPVDTRHPDRFDPTSSTGDGPSPRLRPRVLTKPHRSSVFGSLRSLQSFDEEEETILTKSDSKASSLTGDAESPGRGLFGHHVKKAAEVQVTGTSVFRKRTQFVVLTESHLIRFKSQSKASEMFPIIPNGRGSLPRGPLPSVASYSDMQSAPFAEVTQGVPLDEVVAVYRIEDGRPYFAIEISHLDERGKRGSCLQLNLSGPKDAGAWMNAIRENAAIRRARHTYAYQQTTLDYLARALEKERDYDPLHFRVFKVAQRLPVRPASRMQNDDLSKNTSSLCYLVIGSNKVHLVPLPRTSLRSSSTSLSELEAPSSFGVTSLSSVSLHFTDDQFELCFRTPLRQPYLAALASYDAQQIALWLRFASEYVRPGWTVQPFHFKVPRGVEDLMDPPSFPHEDNDCFDRTLIAFCAALDVDTSRIYYSVDYQCEDAPCFRLLPPQSGPMYSAMELLAVFRSLRYNESFSSMSFAHINLIPLRNIYDPYVEDEDHVATRSGNIVVLPGQANLSVLQQEIRALALKSRKLRRMDFSYSLPLAGGGKLNCGIPEALIPLCKKSFTNVDWITLTGVRLSDNDLDYLVDGASERQCHLRALEVGECGMSVHDVDVLLSTMAIHDNTMEVIDISGVQGRFSPELFHGAIGAFTRIRKLNLTRVQYTAGPEAIVAPEVLLSWRLESLHLNGTPLNESSIDTISTYLASSKSDLLRELSVNQCGLTGKDMAVFFRSMARDSGTSRDLHVSASENRLGVGSSLLCKCISQNYAPASITMRMFNFDKEMHFKELVMAMTRNTTIRSLDISQASLPYDAGMETCEALKEMFAKNQTLEELDMSGDVAHLDVARFGIGLNVALMGLEKNEALKMLRIEHQNLGLQGANTLAHVIEHNRSLLEIHCDHNEINLQSFTVLVNALQMNQTLLFLSSQDADRAKSMHKVKEEFETGEKSDESKSPRTTTLKKSMTMITQKTSKHRRQSSTLSAQSNHSFSEHDVTLTTMALEEKWNHQATRLQQYLDRNYQLRNGVSMQEYETRSEKENNTRPNTGDSLAKMLAQVNFDSHIERTESPVNLVEGKNGGGRKQTAMFFSLPED